MPPSPRRLAGRIALVAAAAVAPAAASIYDNGEPYRAQKVACEIAVDGVLDEPCWAEAPAIESWWETNPGDNVPPPVGNRARLAYDDEFLYAAFEFDEPEPASVRSPFADRDNVSSTTDYGGVILDPRGDGQVAQMFLANARGIQYDAISSDSAGEDSTPDFYWESAGRITEKGWQLEIRIPFASIRYVEADPKSWGILLYRNRPRQFRNQYFSSRLPRDRNCFICNVRPLEGLAGLPTGGHWVAAPYVSASGSETAVGGPGGPLESDGEELDGGADLKWLPNPDTVLDATINPDFSQIESDTAQITANERFAIFQPERRTFFLESVDLLDSPVQAVYTRTITSPKWGARATGGGEKTKYTFLIGEDRGGGSTIIPGSTRSDLADQDFESWVAIGRFRRELGPSSFVSLLYTGREIDGGAFNRVFGPDFRWQANDQNTVTGQLVWSASETPVRPDLAAEWDGRELSGHDGKLLWYRSDGKWDHDLVYEDVSEGFRADNGFVPQVGYRDLYGDFGRTFRPTEGTFRRVRMFSQLYRQEDRDGDLLRQWAGPGIGFDAKWNTYSRFEFNFEEVLGVVRTHEMFYVVPFVEIKPGKVLGALVFEGRIGDQVDFTHDRLGDGVNLGFEADLRPTDHLRLVPSYSRRTLDVETETGLEGRLFTAEVARLLATYTFNTRSWLRAIGQWVGTERDPALWTEPVDSESGEFGGSLVFAYKLNWQTVLYVGYSDLQEYDESDRLEPAERQAFFKISYAFRG